MVDIHASAQALSVAASPLTARGKAQDKETSGVEGEGESLSIREQTRANANVQILKASMEVSIRAGDESQTLLFRNAIDHINTLLAPEFGPDAIQAAASQDNSPEATAGRILSLSTGFYDAFVANHPGEDPAQLAKDFVDLIRGGFEQGYTEATDLLKGMRVWEGDVADGVTQTYDLVHKGLDDFLADKLKGLEADSAGSGPDNPATEG